jgi:hypothetical protein
MVRSILRRACAAVLALLCPVVALATTPSAHVDIVKTDLRPLIRAGIDSPVQFAVSVPHSISTSTGGTWTTAGGQAIWTYAVQVPTAVSLSFHATKSFLPASATLLVRGSHTTASYRARDLHRGELWSRIQPGEALQFTLTVAAAERSQVVFSLVSLQAGYRSLGPGVKDHPYYVQLKRLQTAATSNLTCVTNYECEVTSANTPPGAATVAVVVGNLWQCTGTLLNDVPEDNTPYLLTARHCESGQLGGGDPAAASNVVVYWDATTSCGSALQSIYSTGSPTQTGATTVVEQQDAWLIKLDATPIVSSAQLAGFDASGGSVQGGYTIHHAEGYDKQYTLWFDQAAAVQAQGVLGTNYLSNFWETVNQLGNIAPGASGAALFDQNNHLVGSLTLGRTTTDPSGYGSCPVVNPPAPNGSNGVADFTSLAAIWNSTADTTSTTGPATLKSVLDPGNTGAVVVPSIPAEVIQFSPFTTNTFFVGTPEIIQWNASNASQCTASGGVAGDGWTGTQPAVGQIQITESNPANVTYTLTCTFPNNRTAQASMTMDWVIQAQAQFNVPYVVWTNAPAVLSWSSTVGPCSITGGGLSLSNLAASGTTTTTQTTAGDVNYQLICGSANNNEDLGGLVQYVTPSLIFEANGTDRLLGQTFFLQWFTYATSCIPSGGAPNDGWANTAFPTNGDIAQFTPNVTAAGTYTYTLTCSTGAQSVQGSVTVTFENNPPYVTASLGNSTVTFSDSPADYVSLNWNSNLSTCTVTAPTGIGQTSSAPYPNYKFDTTPLPQGTVTLAPTEPGTFQMTVTCTPPGLNNPGVTSSPLTLTVLPPSPPVVTLSVDPSSPILQGQAFTLSWSASNAQSCSESGTMSGLSQWDQPMVPPSGQTNGTALGAGTYTLGMTCSSVDPSIAGASGQLTVTVEALTATLTASASSVTVGSPFTLTWSAPEAASCTASGGGANGTPWSGSLSNSGTVTQTPTTTGAFTYTITCAQGTATTSQQVTVTVKSSSTGGSSSSGGSGGGGGGGLGLAELALLTALVAVRGRRNGLWGRST